LIRESYKTRQNQQSAKVVLIWGVDSLTRNIAVRKLDEGEVVGGKFVVARRHPTTLLDPIEEPFDPVAGVVEIRAEADRAVAIAFWAGCWPMRCLP
jgi:hypothetical protein